uniref:SH2 domain-containing protein n=1 Tax=Panagrellus redivivus TaxID=6233 RepID=A0A7E4VD01_PANRE
MNSRRTKTPPPAVTPPTYRVFETKDGRLVNKDLGVEWPRHPPSGQRIFDGYVVNNNRGTANYPDTPPGDSNLIPSPPESVTTARDSQRYIGPATLATVNKRLRKNDFIVFYPEPSTEDDLPVEVPLLLAYRSTHNKVYYLPIRREHRRWYVELPMARRPQHTFSNISQLIKHYLTYGFLDPGTGSIEIFPINLLEKTRT